MSGARAALLLLLLAGLLRAAPDPAALRTVVLANASDPDSLSLARHYASRRGIPADNLLALPMPAQETIGWREFSSGVWNPLLRELVARGWIDAVLMASEDATGRRRVVVHGHRVAYLAVMRGVPLRIAEDAGIAEPRPPAPAEQRMLSNASSVDSELSLLPQSLHRAAGAMVNPLFNRPAPGAFLEGEVIKVSRIDGPGLAELKALIDAGLEVERRGLIGRAYVDLGGGPYAEGNQWFEACAAEIEALGFDLDLHRGPATLSSMARMDEPVLYFGWYAGTMNGPFTAPGFHFPPGAVAMHLHSFSAATLHSAGSGWCGPLVARGAAATVGNVWEPYLGMTLRPHILLRSLARGRRLADAAYEAQPVLSWQNIVVGDPLYRPFAMDLDEQWTRRAELPGRLAGYLTLRRMRLLERQGKSAEALELGRAEFAREPSLPLALGLASRQLAAGQAPLAAATLGFAPLLPFKEPSEWPLARAAAELLDRAEAPSQGLDLLLKLLARRDLPSDWREALLPEARRLAARSGRLHELAGVRME